MENKCCIPNYYFNEIKRLAKRRNINVEIDRTYLDLLLKKQDFKCAITGLPLVISSHKKQTCSLDRIDNNGHYTQNNVMFVHSLVNMMKGIYTIDQIYEIFELAHLNKNNALSIIDSIQKGIYV